MSRFEELKEKLAENYGGYTYDHGVKVLGFKNGWDSCAAEYEKLIAEKDSVIENLRTHLLAECNSHKQTLDNNDELKAELSIIIERTNKIAEKDAKLAIAVGALNYILADADVDAHDENQFNKRKVRAALKEIEGE